MHQVVYMCTCPGMGQHKPYDSNSNEKKVYSDLYGLVCGQWGMLRQCGPLLLQTQCNAQPGQSRSTSGLYKAQQPPSWSVHSCRRSQPNGHSESKHNQEMMNQWLPHGIAQRPSMHRNSTAMATKS